MPCARCSTPLFVSYKYEDLRCPNCSNLSITPASVIESEVQDARDLLGESKVIELLKDYKKPQVILALLRMGNKAANQIWDSRGLPIRDFAITPRFIKLLLPETEFGNKELDIDNWPPDTLNTVLKHRFLVLRALNQLEEQFLYAYPEIRFGDEDTLLSRYALYESEFEYCFNRNLRSLIGGDVENQDLFDRVEMELRDFDTPAGDNLQSVRDFAETFYEFIIGISFLLSSDDSLNDVFYHQFPESVTVFDLSELTDALDFRFAGDALNTISEQGELGTTGTRELEAVGRDVFGDDWEAVYEEIVMTPSTPNAHPFLFAMPVDEEMPGSRPGSHVTMPIPRVFYARDYANFIRFQMFPMLHDESGRIGHTVLKEVTDDRGEKYERNVHQYLQRRGFESYHSAKHFKTDEHEVDILALPPNREEIWFIECKYKLPKLRMNTAKGMKEFNKKMTRAVFEEGEAFDEKVEWWMENKPGDRFTAQAGQTDEDRKPASFDASWENLKVRKLVVSNLVPSYPAKRDVLFLTGMEFLKFVETSNLPFQPKHDYLIEGATPDA